MATSLIGPPLVLSALPVAPVPRPPQPTSATFTVWLSAACTCGRATPASADAAANLPLVFKNSRRDETISDSFITPYYYKAPQTAQIFGATGPAEPQLPFGRNWYIVTYAGSDSVPVLRFGGGGGRA